MYFTKASVPFLGATIQTYEKGLPRDIAIKKYIDTLAGKGALGIYDISKKGELVLEGGRAFSWDDVGRIRAIEKQENKILGRIEKGFVAKGISPDEYFKSDEVNDEIVKIYDYWSKYEPELQKTKDKREKVLFASKVLGERLTNRIASPRVLMKWYRVKLERAKTAQEKRKLASDYKKARELRLIEVLKTQPKSARDIYLLHKLKNSKLPWDLILTLP